MSVSVVIPTRDPSQPVLGLHRLLALAVSLGLAPLERNLVVTGTGRGL